MFTKIIITGVICLLIGICLGTIIDDKVPTNGDEVFEKIIERLEKYRNFEDHDSLDRQCVDGAIKIVKEIAEEYRSK